MICRHARLVFAYNVGRSVGAAYIQVMELEFRATIGGATLCSGGTPIFSTQFASSGQYSAAAAFDGGTTNGWSSTSGDLEFGYIGYSFSSIVDVRQVAVTGWVDQVNYALMDGLIQLSMDGTNWETVRFIENQTGWGMTEQRTFNITAGSITGNITESLGITDWIITTHKCSTGHGNGTALATGTTYDVGVFSLEPTLVTISPRIDYKWSAAKTTALNDFVVAVNPDSTPHLWKCTTAGTTGGTEPTWNLSGTTTDNTTTWTYVDALIDPVTLGPKIPS